MYKRAISWMMICTVLSGVSLSIPAYASEEYEINSEYENTSFDFFAYINKMDSMMEHINMKFKKASATSNIDKCAECENNYAIVEDSITKYAEKYYSREKVQQIYNEHKELKNKLDEIDKAYMGNDAVAERAVKRCELYKNRCYELIKIYNAEKDKPDESEISLGDKEVYDDVTKTGFKYYSNNECVYFENGRMLIDEWKQFEDGYRYFGNDGVMKHDVIVSNLNLNSEGVVVSYRNESVGLYFIPGFYGIQDIKFITHTCRVFNIPYEFCYKDTYNKVEDGVFAGVILCDKDSGVEGYEGAVFDTKPNVEAKLITYRYRDRLKIINPV